MQYVYIGIFSKVYDWVFGKILSPVFSFVAKLLSTAISAIYNTILGPLLKEVIWKLILKAGELLWKMIAETVFRIYASLLNIIEKLNSAFDFFTGLRDVTVDDKKMPLLNAMFQIDGLRNAFLMISCIGLVIAFLLAIIATMQSTMDFDFENKRPVSRVLSSLLKSFLNLLTVNFVVLFIIKLSGTILKGIDQALNMVNVSGVQTTLARMIFTVSSLNAAKNSQYNLNSKTCLPSVGIDDAIRKQYLELPKELTKPITYNYQDINSVENNFSFDKFDYLIGFGLSIFLIIVMGSCMIVFVQRIFDMMLLYIVSPLFIGMYPIDDGERFGKWREMFIGKCFSGFGMVMTMKLYLMLCPSILSGSIRFDTSSVETDYLMKMIFLMGGAWAVLKSGNMITTLISQGAGASEQQTSGAMVTMGMAGLSIAGSFAGGLAMKGFHGVGNAMGKASAKSEKEFEDTKFKGDSDSTDKSIPGIGESGLASTPGGGSSGSNVTTTTSSGTENSDAGSATESSASMETGHVKTPRITKIQDAATGAKKTRLFNFGKDAKGNTKRRIAGLGTTRDKDGKIQRVNFGLFSMKRDAMGKLSVDKFKVPLFCNFKRDANTGKIKFEGSKLFGVKMSHDENGSHFKQIGLIGYKGSKGKDGKYHMTNLFGDHFTRAEDKNGNYHITNCMGLFKQEKQEDGQYHVSSVLFGAAKVNRVLEDGELNYSAVRILGFNVHLRDDVKEKNRNDDQK